jgi:dTDP-D-glucose 4,6-dehydratase
MNRTILITGGAGFIGSHVVRLFVNKYPDYRIINLDKLTYAGNLANLKDIEDRPNYRFVKMDICDFEGVLALMQEEKVDGVIHLAAESHVDRSIKDPSPSPAPMSSAPCPCCRRPKRTGRASRRSTRVSVFTTSPPTRCTAPSS